MRLTWSGRRFLGELHALWTQHEENGPPPEEGAAPPPVARATAGEAVAAQSDTPGDRAGRAADDPGDPRTAPAG